MYRASLFTFASCEGRLDSQNADCGYDAGDCGIDVMREKLLEVRLLPERTMNVTLNSTHASAFFNLTAVFPSSILSASHTNPNLIIGASVSQTLKART